MNIKDLLEVISYLLVIGPVILGFVYWLFPQSRVLINKIVKSQVSRRVVIVLIILVAGICIGVLLHQRDPSLGGLVASSVNPDIDATVRAAIAATEAARPTSTYTPTPTPTRTPSPTPTPTPTIDADPSVYDNFNNPANDGSFNGGRWHLDNTEGVCEIEQHKGNLVFSVRNTSSSQGAGCSLGGPKAVLGNQLQLFETKMKISSEVKGDTLVNMSMSSDGFTGGGWFECGLASYSAGATAYFGISTHNGTVREFWKQNPAEYNHWYTIRYEVKPSTMEVSCFVENILIGKVIPKDASRLYRSNVDRFIQNYLAPAASATTFIDDVRIIP